MTPPLLDGPAPPAPFFEGPLYVGGRRRPGPNKFGFDPFAPLLEPEPTREPPHKLCVAAADHWRNRETFERRHRTHPELLRRRKKGARRQKRGPQIGRYQEHELEVREHKRGDRIAVICRILAFCALRASIKSGEVGIWDGREQLPCNREKLARYARVPVRRDDKNRVRCDQLDLALTDLVSAGLILRFQTRAEEAGKYRGHVATMKLTPLFWLCSGVGPIREKILKKATKNAAKLARGPRLADPAAQARAFIAAQASAHVVDYGPNGPAAGGRQAIRRTHPGDDPPPA